VARQDPAVRELSEKFVCVRLVKMNGVDLRQFQFDFDMTWAAFFVHHDGTVLARYGSRSPVGPMIHNSAKGLVATMGRVLEVYKGFPANRALFEAKRGPDPGYGTPEEILTKRRGGRGSGRVGRDNCIHCHNVHERMHDREMAEDSAPGFRRPKKIFKYPPPEVLGIGMDKDVGNVVTSVVTGSPAEKGGLRKGDVIDGARGQAMLSIADFQFALHHAPDEGRLDLRVTRDGQNESLELELAKGWKRHDFTWRVSMAGFPPESGLYVHKLSAEEKSKLSIAENDVGLEVRGLFKPAVARSGLKVGDVIVGYDGRKLALGSLAFQNYARVHHFEPGSILKLEVLREGERKSVKVRF